MKTAIITDSACNLTREFFQANNDVYQIPLMIMIDEKPFRDQLEIEAQAIYEQIDHAKITSSLPQMDDLEALLSELKQKGYTHLLVINVSSGLSGTFNAFRLFLEEHKEFEITHYDSKTLAGHQGFLVQAANEWVQENVPMPEIVKKLDELRYKDSMAFYTINTLKYLKKGGRIGFVEGTIADILHIKPVITVNFDGVYETLNKGFGLNRALIAMKQHLIEKFGSNPIDLIIHYGTDHEKAVALGERLKQELTIKSLSITPLTPVLGIHTGPDMFAYIARNR